MEILARLYETSTALESSQSCSQRKGNSSHWSECYLQCVDLSCLAMKACSIVQHAPYEHASNASIEPVEDLDAACTCAHAYVVYVCPI